MLTLDGFEDINMDNFDMDSFNVDNLKKTTLTSNAVVKEGDKIYKLIIGDRWNLVFPINDDEKERLKDEKYINVRFKQDDYTTYGAADIIKQGSKEYMSLEFDDSIERYADNRFLTIEMLLNNKSGLKIPNSAITKKEFM